MITSKDNPKLKLVRALQRKKEREETGLFACEGEDLCDAALAAGIEPVDLLVAGENVEPELLAGVSTLPHPPRAIGVFRRDDLPRRSAGHVPRPVAALGPRQRGHADSLGRCVRRSRLALGGLRRPTLPEGAAGKRGRDLPGAAACRGTSGPAVRSRSTRAARCRSWTSTWRRR